MLQEPPEGGERTLLLLEMAGHSLGGSRESCYNQVSAPVAGVNCLCVDCLSLCLLVLVISFCVLEFGLIIFLDMGQTESTLLNILVNHWREVRERGENLSVVVKKGKLVTLCFSE